MHIVMGGTGIVKVPPIRGGAIESHVYGLANAYARLGHTVSLVSDTTSRARFDPSVTPVPVNSPIDQFPVRFPLWIGSHIIGGYKVFEGVIGEARNNGHGVDVVHLHEEISSVLCGRILKRIPLVFTPHNPFPFMGQVRKKPERLARELASWVVTDSIFPRCSHVVCLTQQFRTWIVENLRFPPERATYIPHAVDTAFFSPAAEHCSGTTTMPGLRAPYILYVGRLDSRKGVDLLIKAYRRSCAQTQCVLVGTGPLEPTIREMAREEISDGRVLLLSSVEAEALAALYAGAQFLVLPSWSECSPLVVLEAMSSGIPVVASALPVLADVIEQGRNGRLFPTGDLQTLERTIRWLSEDPRKCSEWGKNARERIVKENSTEGVAKRLLGVYRGVAH